MEVLPTFEPNILDALLILGGGDCSLSNPLRPGETGGLIPSCRDGKAEDVERRPKKLLFGFGGNVAGRSSELVLVLVVPVLWRGAGGMSAVNDLTSYFCRM